MEKSHLVYAVHSTETTRVQLESSREVFAGQLHAFNTALSVTHLERRRRRRKRRRRKRRRKRRRSEEQ